MEGTEIKEVKTASETPSISRRLYGPDLSLPGQEAGNSLVGVCWFPPVGFHT